MEKIHICTVVYPYGVTVTIHLNKITEKIQLMNDDPTLNPTAAAHRGTIDTVHVRPDRVIQFNDVKFIQRS